MTTDARRPRGLLLAALLLAATLAACGGDGVGEAGGGLAGDGDSAETGDQLGNDTGDTGDAEDTEDAGDAEDAGEELPDQQSGVLIGASFSQDEGHDFGTVPVGGSVNVILQVRALLTALPFEVTDVAVTGTGFALVDGSGCVGVTLTEQQPHCVAVASFAPAEAGAHEGTFVVTGVRGGADPGTATAPDALSDTAPEGPVPATVRLRLQGVGG